MLVISIFFSFFKILDILIINLCLSTRILNYKKLFFLKKSDRPIIFQNNENENIRFVCHEWNHNEFVIEIL